MLENNVRNANDLYWMQRFNSLMWVKGKYNALVVLIIINTVTQLANRLQFCHSYIALFHNYKYYDYAYAYAMSVPFSPDGLNADMLPLNQELIFYLFFYLNITKT